MDCVEVCPVDCFYVGANMLVIHPDECIDCGVCEPECPVEAIVPDSDDKAGDWLEQNRTYAALWPNITRKGEAPADADDWKDKPDKAKLFDPEPGKAWRVFPQRDVWRCGLLCADTCDVPRWRNASVMLYWPQQVAVDATEREGRSTFQEPNRQSGMA
jgi:ferredoxin